MGSDSISLGVLESNKGALEILIEQTSEVFPPPINLIDSFVKDDKEKTFFLQRWAAYVTEHKDMNMAEDFDDLISLIFEIINMQRLRSELKTKPTSKLLQADLAKSSKRNTELKATLFGKAAGKVGRRGGGGGRDIASLSKELSEGESQQKRIEESQNESKKFLDQMSQTGSEGTVLGLEELIGGK